MGRNRRMPGSSLRAAAVAAVLLVASGSTARDRQSAPAANIGNGKRIPASVMALSELQLPVAAGAQSGSVLNVKAPMKFGEYVWDDKEVPRGPIVVRVDLNAQLISVFRGGHEIGTAVILHGADEKPTPTGAFPIKEKLQDHRSSLYGAEMPYTLRLTDDGIAIHGSNVRKGAATHGCIGVPTAFGALLFNEARTGDKVIIV